MKQKFIDSTLIPICFTEEEARFLDDRAGWDMRPVIDDPYFKQIYLRQQLTNEDVQAFIAGEITANLQETLDDVYLSVSEIDIQFSSELRENLIRVLQ